MKLTLYTKPDCCLCDEALEALEHVRAERPFELESVDISGDPELIRRYGERIPVVHVSGIPTFEHRVDEDELRRLLDQVPTFAGRITPPSGDPLQSRESPFGRLS